MLVYFHFLFFISNVWYKVPNPITFYEQVIAALSEKMSETHNLFKLNKILQVSEQNVKTSFDLKSLKTLYSKYKGAGNAIDKLSISGQNLVYFHFLFFISNVWYKVPNPITFYEVLT